MIDHPTIYREQADNGHWYEIALHDGVISRCRLTGEHDESSHELHGYDGRCALCWLGYGHSGDYHRAELAGKVNP